MVRGLHTGDGVEERRTAIHRFEMRKVLLLHGHGIFPHLVLSVSYFEVEHVLRLLVTHGQDETIYVHISVDEYAVLAFGLGGRDGHGVGECGDVAHQLIFGISGVVERAVDG